MKISLETNSRYRVQISLCCVVTFAALVRIGYLGRGDFESADPTQPPRRVVSQALLTELAVTPLITPERALRVVEIITAACESQASGGPIDLTSTIIGRSLLNSLRLRWTGC